MATLRIPPASGDRARMGEYLSTVSYMPEQPDGWPVDEFGIPVVEPDDAEEADERL